MSQAPLPRQVDVRKLAAAAKQISAFEPLSSFGRFSAMLTDHRGDVAIDLAFHISDEGVRVVDGHVQGEVGVLCQRCLQPMRVPLDSRFSVGVVWTDEQARALAKRLEPWELGEPPHDLLELVEDELIMSLPFVSFHQTGACSAEASPQSGEAPAAGSRRENPFKVLEQLKSGTGKSDH